MKLIAIWIGAFVALILFITAVNAFGLASFSFWAPKYEEARREVVQQSTRQQEGVSEGIGALCLNMKLEEDPGRKKAFARLIVEQAGATGTNLTPAAQDCADEASNVLGV